MQKDITLLFLVVVLNSCFLVKDYKKKEFSYTANGQPVKIQMLVPRGYIKSEVADTAGIHLQTFTYPSGAILYSAYLTDTSFYLQPIREAEHQPLTNTKGGLIYKGQDSSELYYREIRQGRFRFGYRFVPEIREASFDSATNFTSLLKN